MKILKFQHRGEWYKVMENGNLLQENNTYNEWDNSWIFLGVSKHYRNNYPTITLKEIFENPEIAIGGYVWDMDHGTHRQWLGNYCGHLPKIQNAYIENIE